MVTPAQSSFETMLQSDQTSLRFLELIEGDAELAIKFIILDFCRSSMALWENFLLKLTTSIALPNGNPISLIGYERDLAHVLEFSALVRDLCSCTSFLTSSIASDHFTEKSASSKGWDHLLLEIRTSEAVLHNSVQQLLDIVKPKFDMAVADSTASQATSLKRLTVIAVIFLPLSLASSLLAMTESVKGIGEHWFDWLGLWLTMGFLVALVYSLWKSIDHLIARPIAGDVILEFLETVRNFLFPWSIPIFCVVVVSFWIGMLHGLYTVPETLKWGFVAVLGLVAIRLLLQILPYIFSLFWYGLRKSRGKRGIYYLLMGREIYLNLKRRKGTTGFDGTTGFKAAIGDMFIFGQLIVSIAVPDVVSLPLPGVELHGLVERIFNATARSKRAKRFIRCERELFRQIVEEVDQMQDQRAREIVDEIRSIVGTDTQVQELLAGII